MPKVVTQRCLEQDLKPRPTDLKPKCLTQCTTAPPSPRRTTKSTARRLRPPSTAWLVYSAVDRGVGTMQLMKLSCRWQHQTNEDVPRVGRRRRRLSVSLISWPHRHGRVDSTKRRTGKRRTLREYYADEKHRYYTACPRKTPPPSHV